MTIAQVEAFLAVARYGKVREAAEHEHMSQPALTARIKGLERELGARLFHRLARGMSLTSVGRAFLPYAEDVVAAAEAGTAIATEVGQGLAGQLTIGAAASVSTYVLPEMLARFLGQRPQIRLSVRTGHPADINRMVAIGEVQIGIMRDGVDASVVARPLYDEELLLVARPDVVAASDGSRRKIARFVQFDRAPDYVRLTTELLRELGIPHRSIMDLDNIAAAKRMVERGLGVALLPATAVADALTDGRLTSLDLPGLVPVRRHMMLVSQRNVSYELPVSAALCDLLVHIPDIIPGALRPLRADDVSPPGLATNLHLSTRREHVTTD
jgi:DNA-binding transcriptional LysR family regulator